MFIPLHDANGLKHIRLQYVTIGLIAVNIIVFLLTALGDRETVQAAEIGFGYIPAVANDLIPLHPDLVLVPEDATYVTYAFLHADIMHIGGNMLFLWVFGDNVEDALGHFKFLIFFLACAAAGAFFHGIILPDSKAPLIGASGAVAGIVAAYLLLHPKVKVWVLAFGRLPLRIPALIPLIIWIGFQFVMLFTDIDGAVSWGAHVGGIVAGALLVLVMRRSGVPLFDSTIVTPSAVETVPAVAEPPQKTPSRWGRQ